jgi:Uma2 family endonuclease
MASCTFIRDQRGHFGPNVVVLAASRGAPALTAAHFSVAPDWVCEVLSPRTARLDRGRNADLWVPKLEE